MILQTFNQKLPVAEALPVYCDTTAVDMDLELNGPWKLSFIEEAPKVSQTFTLDNLQTWEILSDEARVTMGTGVYETTVKLKKKDLKDATAWKIDLGDVRESARVYINGQYLGCAWSVPYVLDCKNTLNKMEEINVVDINYKKTLYDTWEPMPSGLNSQVKLIGER